MASASQISFRNLGRQSWASAPTPRGGTRDGTPGSSCPTGGCGEPPRLPWPAAHSGAFAPAGARTWAGNGAEITPKVSSNLGQSLSHGCAVPAPFAQGSLGDGGCGSPRRFALRNDSPDSLSFRGGPTGRRGNPSFLRWTGVRAAPRKTRETARRVVVPYGKPDQPPKPAGAQRSVRTSGGEGWAGIDARTIPKGGPPPRPPGQRLAKRKARG